MKKNVLIKLTSIQYTDEEPVNTELITDAAVEINAEEMTITYNESSVTGFEGSVTVVRVKNDNTLVSIERNGKVNSDLIIEKGIKHHCHYTTPYGDVSIGILATQINNTIKDFKGRLDFKYTIDANSSYLSENEIIIEI